MNLEKKSKDNFIAITQVTTSFNFYTEYGNIFVILVEFCMKLVISSGLKASNSYENIKRRLILESKMCKWSIYTIKIFVYVYITFQSVY